MAELVFAQGSSASAVSPHGFHRHFSRCDVKSCMSDPHLTCDSASGALPAEVLERGWHLFIFLCVF